MAVDWLKIKNDYINGGGSYRQLSQKHGVSLRTLAKHASDEGWQEEKERHCNNIATSLQQKTAEKVSEALSDEAAAKVRIRGKLIRMAENWIDKMEETIEDTGDYRRIVQSCIDLGVMDSQEADEYDGDGLIEALAGNAGVLFDDGDDSTMLPEEESE